MSVTLPIDDRNCYNCEHYRLCFLRHRIDDSISGTGMLNIDGDAAPRGFNAVFEALAMACMEFRRKESG